jgi:uncharacterized protein YcbX
MHVSAINIYPIKSLKGISVRSAMVEQRGLSLDRRWMLTTPEGKFITQRELPKMATITVAVRSDGLLASNADHGEILVPFAQDGAARISVTVWQSVCDGLTYNSLVNEWFSDVIGTDCRLVYMPDNSLRSVNKRFNGGEDIVSFADGYPLMILGEASLDDLNEKISESADNGIGMRLPMNRFRPNLVITGAPPFAEDSWKRIRIGDAVFRSTKPCERCVITTVEQSLGEFDGKEPLATLAKYRMAKDVIPDTLESLGVGPNAVLFGQNLIGETHGTAINLGDPVTVIE